MLFLLAIPLLLLVAVGGYLLLWVVVSPYVGGNRLLHKFPFPKRHLIWGHLNRFTVGPSWTEFALRLTNEYRRTWLIWLGPIPNLVVCTPEVMKQFLSEDSPKNYVYTKFLSPWMGKGLLTNSGSDWQRKRRMITPGFHFDVLKQFIPIFAKNTAMLLEDWEGLVKRAEKEEGARCDHVDIQMATTYLSLDNIGECAFGVHFNAIRDHDSPFVKATLDASKQLFDRVVSPLMVNDFIYNLSPGGRANSRTLHVLHEYSRSALQLRRCQLESAADPSARSLNFLDILLTAKDSDGKGLTEREMLDEVDTFMFEGHDTTSSGLMWTLYCISQHPEVEAKVLAEIDAVLPRDVLPDYEHLQALPYLTKVLKESHRLYPPVPSIGRVVERKGVIVEGNELPIGATVVLLLVGIHHNAGVWPEPLKFDPERFSDENSAGRHPYAYVPFSGGPRNCIGQKFALLEEKAVISMIYSKFRLEFVVGQSVAPYAEMVLRNQGPLYMKLIPRRQVE